MDRQLMDAVVRLRAAAEQASTGPWRACSSGAVIAPEHQPSTTPEDVEYYGGHLVAESMSSRDVLYLTMVSPERIVAICDAVMTMLKAEQRRDDHRKLNADARDKAEAACEATMQAIKRMGD